MNVNQTPWWFWLLLAGVVALGVALAPRMAGLVAGFLPAA